MRRVCLVGNAGNGKTATDGQRIKVQTYKTVLELEGFKVYFVELDSAKIRFLKILSDIRKYMKICDTILLLTSDNGEKILVPYINRLNKKYKKKFIFSHIGTSSLYRYIRDLDEERKTDFFINHNFSNLVPDKRYAKQLRKIDIILPETELITGAYSAFYNLQNCVTLTNFRLCHNRHFKEREHSSTFKIIYISRITAEKGIFDLIAVTEKLIKQGLNIKLDIYGDFQLSNSEMKMFNSKLSPNIVYMGSLSNQLAIETISDYDITCFPTRCKGEGVPGVLVESLLAGVPIITANFSQASQILKDNYDSLFFEIYSCESLQEKIEFAYHNLDKLYEIRKNAYKSGERYSYEYSRKLFLNLLK